MSLKPHTGDRANPFRVVLLLEELDFGGTQRHALELAKHLDPIRFQPEIWTMAGGKDMLPLAVSAGVRVRRLSGESTVGHRSLHALWRALKTSPVDALLLLTVIPNIWGRIFGRLARIPVIVGTCRGGLSPSRQHDRFLWPLLHHHITNTHDLKRILVERYGVPARLITVIPNGVDTDHFRPRGEGSPSPGKLLLCVARLVPDKDHGTLIEAFRLVSQKEPLAELRIVGNGQNRRTLQMLISQLKLSHRVRVIPGQEDLRDWYARSRLFVLSSVAEGLPNVILEAMASGLPVVATAVGGLPEVVRHGESGWLVPAGNPVALSEAILHVLRDEDSGERMGKVGRAVAESRYSIRAMVDRHERLLLRLFRRER